MIERDEMNVRGIQEEEEEEEEENWLMDQKRKRRMIERDKKNVRGIQEERRRRKKMVDGLKKKKNIDLER